MTVRLSYRGIGCVYSFSAVLKTSNTCLFSIILVRESMAIVEKFLSGTLLKKMAPAICFELALLSSQQFLFVTLL